ncbi:hypothetical protein [Bartonella chomelii]|nr:hypothetical protein [Bartonella chomelii]
MFQGWIGINQVVTLVPSNAGHEYPHASDAVRAVDLMTVTVVS